MRKCHDQVKKLARHNSDHMLNISKKLLDAHFIRRSFVVSMHPNPRALGLKNYLALLLLDSFLWNHALTNEYVDKRL